ncbi:hypothetical protein DUNSADRAFT_14592 [Dunaliella salina]|uniref:Encoded protein n=1 Tax=Dunaliella salina TaxID=3046 RepID=A0ABQ7H2F0_DUNSA|nr:hypothetical protein DUNSADRAFT_14592 [Dunaliella salina]|eukprot:KAF5841034.1 hypothetical protein DUNSADRAFT_14592 [Dunaliella salina]
MREDGRHLRMDNDQYEWMKKLEKRKRKLPKRQRSFTMRGSWTNTWRKKELVL